MGYDLRYVLGSLVWKLCVREAEGREIEHSELLQSELLVGWKAIKQKRETYYNDSKAHLLVCQIF